MKQQRVRVLAGALILGFAAAAQAVPIKTDFDDTLGRDP